MKYYITLATVLILSSFSMAQTYNQGSTMDQLGDETIYRINVLTPGLEIKGYYTFSFLTSKCWCRHCRIW